MRASPRHIPPKRFDIFPPDWGMLRRSRCVQFFLLSTTRSCRLILVDPMLLPSGNPFKCHQEVFVFAAWRMLRRFRCVQIFLLSTIIPCRLIHYVYDT